MYLCTQNKQCMRLFKEVWGIIWEFDSVSDYAAFTLGRVLGAIIFIALILLGIWFFV